MEVNPSTDMIDLVIYLYIKLLHRPRGNRPIAQILPCFEQLYHNAPFCNTNVNRSAHVIGTSDLFYKYCYVLQ